MRVSAFEGNGVEGLMKLPPGWSRVSPSGAARELVGRQGEPLRVHASSKTRRWSLRLMTSPPKTIDEGVCDELVDGMRLADESVARYLQATK